MVHACEHRVHNRASLQAIRCGDGSLTKVAQAAASLIARSSLRGTARLWTEAPLHMQDTPFKDTELCSPVCVSDVVDVVVSHRPVFMECANSSRRCPATQMHLEQNRGVVEKQRDQGSKFG